MKMALEAHAMIVKRNKKESSHVLFIKKKERKKKQTNTEVCIHFVNCIK